MDNIVDGRELAAASRRDLLVVGALTLTFFATSVVFELSEQILSWTQPWERYELDEIPGTLLVLALGLAWFAWRRVREARRQLAERIAAQQHLAQALAENQRLSISHVRVQENERKELARELHDELGQHLNFIKLNAVAIRNRSESGLNDLDGVHDAAVAVVEAADHVHGTVRDMLRKLRPVGLDELGLAAALEHLVQGWQARNPETRAELRITGSLDHLRENGNIAIYRLVQEGLNNVTRHARARAVTISLNASSATTGGTADSDAIVLTIADDGVGARAEREAAGLGLIGMRERIEGLRGSLAIEADPGAGFRIRATLPRPVQEERA